MLTIVTFTSVLAAWLSVFAWLGCIAVCLILFQKFAAILKTVLLDVIQLYAGWAQAKLDMQHKQLKLTVLQGEARLILRDQRRQLNKQLLAEIETS